MSLEGDPKASLEKLTKCTLSAFGHRGLFVTSGAVEIHASAYSIGIVPEYDMIRLQLAITLSKLYPEF